MTGYILTDEAEADLEGVFDASAARFGLTQAERYLGRIEASLSLIVSNPKLGRRVDVLRVGLRRHEIGSHVLYYVIENNVVVVARVLHKRMEPAQHL